MHTIHSPTRQYHYQRVLSSDTKLLSPSNRVGKKVPFHSTHSQSGTLLSPKKRKFVGAIDTESSSHTVKIQFDKNFIVVYFITNALREMYKNTLIEGRGQGMSKGGKETEKVSFEGNIKDGKRKTKTNFRV